MKIIQIKFKALLLALIVGIAFSSCSKEDTPDVPDPLNNLPITLDCNYFMDNPDAVLKDNPDAPIDYIITCPMTINDKLTIEAGVVVAFEQDAGMKFTQSSYFQMNGTAAKPILFTGTQQTKGFWRGVYTESSNTNNKMSYVTVDYAGGNELGHGLKACLTVYGDNSPITLENCTFSNSEHKGMIVDAPNSIAKDKQNVFITNCTFTKNDIPIQSDASRLRMYNASNSFTGNNNDYVLLNKGNIHGNATWAKLNVPYLMRNETFSVDESVLTIEPGVEIIMSAQNRIFVKKESALVMVGTANEPITIRGEQDVAGYWKHIFIGSKSILNEIGHVNIKNGGEVTGHPNGAVQLWYSKTLNIHDVVFSKCYEYGISLDYSGDPFNLEYSNLSLDNTPHLFSDWEGNLVINP